MNTLKLNQLEKNHLSQKEMNQVQGGNWICTCSCKGPSGTMDNGCANAEISGGGSSTTGDNDYHVPVCTPDK